MTICFFTPKIKMAFFSPMSAQLLAAKVKPFITASHVPGRVRNTLQDTSCLRLKKLALEAEEV